MKWETIDKVSFLVIIVEVVWRVIMEKISAPQWMHYVEWIWIILIFVCIILQLHFKRKEKKQNKK